MSVPQAASKVRLKEPLLLLLLKKLRLMETLRPTKTLLFLLILTCSSISFRRSSALILMLRVSSTA